MDFASLYPSIQVAFKICYTTLVLDPIIYKKLFDIYNALKIKTEHIQIPNDVTNTIYDAIEW